MSFIEYRLDDYDPGTGEPLWTSRRKGLITPPETVIITMTLFVGRNRNDTGTMKVIDLVLNRTNGIFIMSYSAFFDWYHLPSRTTRLPLTSVMIGQSRIPSLLLPDGTLLRQDAVSYVQGVFVDFGS